MEGVSIETYIAVVAIVFAIIVGILTLSQGIKTLTS